MRLLAITPGDGRDLRPWLQALADAGLEAVLIREPGLADVERLLGIVPRTIVHERTPGAGVGDGVHLRAGGDPRAWDLPAGVSCHSEAEVDAAFAAGAAYCLLSPVWSPSSKADDRPTLGPERFAAVAAGRAVLALGGVTADRFGRVERAAVCGDLFGRESPEAAARRLREYRG